MTGSRAFARLSASAVLLLAAACSPAPSPGLPSPSAPEPSSPSDRPPATIVPTASASTSAPPAVLTFTAGDLAGSLPDVLVVCEPADVDGRVACGDLVTRAGAMAMQRVTASPLERLYLVPVTGTAPEAGTTGALYAATLGGAWHMTVRVFADGRSGSVTEPVPTDPMPWPASLGSAVPAIARQELEGAPDVVDQRTPLPFCGQVEDGQDPLGAWRCFRDAVVEGRAAEVIAANAPFGGTPAISIFRFDGTGAITTFSRGGGVDAASAPWSRAVAVLTLLPGTAGDVSVETFDEAAIP